MTKQNATLSRRGAGAVRDHLRIVQVETFYQPYLDRFYGLQPHLRGASFTRQTTALLQDGFSAVHNIAPYLEELGYDAHYIVANCAPAQSAWMREAGMQPPADGGMATVLRQQIDALDPDILYFSNGVSFGADFVRSLKRRPRLVMAWHGAPVPDGTDWSEIDVLLSGLSGMRAWALRLGAKAAEPYMPAFPADLADAIGLIEERHDVVFSGSYTPVQHAGRNALLSALGRKAQAGGFDCAFHLAVWADPPPPEIAQWCHAPVFGMDMLRALRAGRIVFDSRSAITALSSDGNVVDLAGSETVNMRLFEATGSGAFLMTEDRGNLADYFEPGHEIEVFRSAGELLEKVRHYLAHPEERRTIAERGRQRCRSEHGMDRRIRDFDAIVRRHMPAASSVGGRAEPAAVRHYCTYFDSAYAPRGLAMMDSVLRFTPDARFHVLCLDDTALRIVREHQPRAAAISLADLEAFDPDLHAARSGRSLVEFYFTCTPCLPRYVLDTIPDAEAVTYLDADLYFYQSPERVFEEIGDSSIAIVPHRFAPACADSIRYGVYNVAWVTWCNDAEGRRCLEDYRAQCLDWCFDRLEGDRFADQKYLDAWPERYRSVHVLAGKGMNTAPWNVEQYRLAESDGAVTVDGEPLVFFHFHGLKYLEPGRWQTRFEEYHVRRNLPFIEPVLLKPYTERVEEVFMTLSKQHDFTIAGDRRAVAEPPRPDPAARVSDGYGIIDETAALLSGGPEPEAWHHDDVAAWQDAAYANLIAEMHQGHPRVDLRVAAEAVRATNVRRPSLVEIGCGSGYYCEVFDALLPGPLDYTGVDLSPAMLALARRRYPGRTFVQGDATRLDFADASFDVVFNGVSLMHIPDYRAVVAESRRVARRYCIFHTVPLLKHRATTYLRKLAYGRPVVEAIFNRDALTALLAVNGLHVVREWDSVPYDLSGVLGESTESRTLLCEVT